MQKLLTAETVTFGLVGVGKKAEKIKLPFLPSFAFFPCFCFRGSDCSVALLLVFSEHKTCQFMLTSSSVLCSLLGFKMNVSLMP